MVNHFTEVQTASTHTSRPTTMSISNKTAVAVIATIALAHVAAFAFVSSAMPSRAVEIRVAEPIVVQAATQKIVKAERIEVRPTRTAAAASAAKPAI